MKSFLVAAFMVICCCSSVTCNLNTESKVGCFLMGHTRKVSIPGCVEFTVTTNACRGFCESFAVPTAFALDRKGFIAIQRPNHPVTSVAQCCSIMESEDSKVRVLCGDGIREITFKSATNCSCYHCKKTTAN
ncbi:unnamed protein product [Diamesa serratosioi]